MIPNGDGSIILSTKIDTSGINKGMTSIKSIVSKIGGIMAAAFSVRVLVNFGKGALNLASDLEKVQNVVDTAFGNMAHKAEEFSKTTIESFGMSELSAKRTASTFMAMGKGMGIAEEAAADMALTLTGLTGDIASFYNMSQERADVILKSVYTGETETLKQLGIVMTEVNLENFAMSKGITKSISAMTQQEKTMLRYQFVMEQTRLAQGDFVRTQDSWANQTRILSERWKEMQRIFGETFMMIGTLVLPTINAVVNGLSKIAELTKNVAGSIYTAFTGKEFNSVPDTEKEIADNIGIQAENQKELNKEMKKTLAGFDEIQILSSNAAEGTFPASESVSTQPGATRNTGNSDTSSSDFLSAIQRIKEEIRAVVSLFMSGFWRGFQNADFSPIVKSFREIRENINGIFASGEVQTAAQSFSNSFTVALGQTIGSFASIGTTIAQNLIGGFGLYLQSNSPFIQTSIADIFDASAGIVTPIGNTFNTFARIFKEFSSTKGIELTSNIIGIFANAGLGITELALKAGEDFISFLTKPITDNAEEIRSTLGGIIEIFSANTGTIKELSETLFKEVNTLYDEHISPLLKTASESLSGLFKIFLESYEKYCKPVLEEFAKEFETLVEKHLKPMFEEIFKYIGKATDVLNWLWKNILHPILGRVIEMLMINLSNALNTAKDVFFLVVTFIADRITSLYEVFNGIIDFITGVFSGDWEKAWEGLKNIFKGIINSIIAIAEGMVNGIITGINTVINGLNGLVGKAGSIIGLELHIPEIPKIKIPRLAKGAVIPPNREFLAVLGDQKQGANIEAPAELIKQMTMEAIAEMGGGGNQTVREEHYYLNETELMRVLYRLVKGGERLNGKSLIDGGIY